MSLHGCPDCHCDSPGEAFARRPSTSSEWAPESRGGGLREVIARALHYDWHSDEEWDAIPDSVSGYYRRLADVTLALPELAALRAKAAAADRVRECIDGMDPIEVALGGLMYVHSEVRSALDGNRAP